MTCRGTVIGLATAAVQLLACGGGPGQPKQLAEVPIPNNPSRFVFDIGYAVGGERVVEVLRNGIRIDAHTRTRQCRRSQPPPSHDVTNSAHQSRGEGAFGGAGYSFEAAG